MKSALNTGLLVLALGLATSSIANADDDRPGFPRYAGTYLIDVTLDKIGQFDCQFLLDLGFVETCDGHQVFTLHADGTMQANDTSDFNDGFDGVAQGNWQRAGFRSLAVSGKTISLGYDVEGIFERYLIREFSLEFSRDRTTFSGNSSTSVFSDDQDPLDPAETPDVVVTATLTGRKL